MIRQTLCVAFGLVLVGCAAQNRSQQMQAVSGKPSAEKGQYTFVDNEPSAPRQLPKTVPDESTQPLEGEPSKLPAQGQTTDPFAQSPEPPPTANAPAIDSVVQSASDLAKVQETPPPQTDLKNSNAHTQAPTSLAPAVAFVSAVTPRSVTVDLPRPPAPFADSPLARLRPEFRWARRTQSLGDLVLWPNGVVPVVIDASIGEQATKMTQMALAAWNTAAKAIIRFKPWDHEEHMVVVTKMPQAGHPHLRDLPEGMVSAKCTAIVGMNPNKNGATYVFLTETCGFSQILHELGHALGLKHEMTPTDRDAYIKVHPSRMRNGVAKIFDTNPENETANRPYDVRSIMHYQAEAFNSGLGPVLEPKDSSVPLEEAGINISDGDIASLYALYKTPAPDGVAADHVYRNEKLDPKQGLLQISKFAPKVNFAATRNLVD